MGTRSQFFIGDPSTIGNQWLGCAAYDGGPCQKVGQSLKKVIDEESFRSAVRKMAKELHHFTDPADHDYPFPWICDVFLTDATYAWIDGRLMFTPFHRGWIHLEEYFNHCNDEHFAWIDDQDELPYNISAPTGRWDRTANDGFLIIRCRPDQNG